MAMEVNDLRNKKKKFVFCSPVSPISKIHKYRPYFEFTNSMRELGFESFLIIGKLNFDYSGPIKVLETGIYSNRHLDVPKTLPFILKFIKKEKPDIFLFFHMNLIIPLVVIASVLFLREHKTKFIIKMDWDGSTFEEVGRLMFLRNILLVVESFFVDKLIIENECGLRAIYSIPLLPKKKVLMIPNTYSENLIQRASYLDKRRSKTILTVSRISPEKGIDVLISAFASLSSELPDWSLKIIGPVDDQQYFNNLDMAIKNSGLTERVKFMGPMYDEALKNEYYDASIFCLPSNTESFGIARIEAIAAGLPLVTSEAGCGKTFEEMGSLVFKIGDVEGLRNCLRNLISNSELRVKVANMQQSHLLSYKQIVELFLSAL